MLLRPALREDFSAYSVFGEGDILLSDTESLALEGVLTGEILPLIDGQRTRFEIATALAGRGDVARVYGALDYMAAQGHLHEADPFASEEGAVFWSALGLDTRKVRDAMLASAVCIAGLECDTGAVCAQMHSPGLVTVADPKAPLRLLVLLARSVVLGANPAIEGIVNEVQPMHMARRSHPVTRRPQCPCCGDPRPGVIGSARAVFAPTAAATGQENSERARSALETCQKFRCHISPLTGLVKEVVPMPWNGTTPLRSFSAGNTLAVNPMGLAGVKQNLRSLASGKGRSDVQARTSALCAALERCSGKVRSEEVVLPARLRDLDDAGLHPNDVMPLLRRAICGAGGMECTGQPFPYRARTA